MSDNTPDPSESPIKRPGLGCFFFTVPLAFALLVTLAYVILFGVGSQGFLARGERVEIGFETCPEAQELLAARVEHIGLGSPTWRVAPSGLVLTATLPGGPIAELIPATLARQGVFAVREGTTPDGAVIVGRDQVRTAEFSLKEMGNPLVLLTLTPQGRKQLETHMEGMPQGSIGVWLDDEPILVRENDPPFRREQIDVRAEGEDGTDNLRRAVDWAMLITYGPLPCPTRLSGVAPATRP